MTQLPLHPNFNLEKAREWVLALESGTLKQTEGKLVSNNGQSFCCLGVACKLQKWKTVKDSEGSAYMRPFGNTDEDLWENEMAPANVLEVLGLEKYSGYSNGYSILNAANYAEMNDNGSTFAEIAAQLREDYLAIGVVI